MKTEPVTDSTDITGVELRSSLIKTEASEESIERKNGYGMNREEELILSKLKEEEEGGERQREEMKREDGVKEEVAGYEWKEEKEWNRDEMEQTERGLKQDGLPDCKKQEDEDLKSHEATSCLFQQPRVPSPGSPAISSSKGQSEVFFCSQCPFTHMEEGKLHQHVEKVHPEDHSRTLDSGENGAANPLPPSSTHQHPTPPKTLPTPTQSHTGTPGAHTCSQCGKSFRSISNLTSHKQTHTGVCHTEDSPYHCSQWGKRFSNLHLLTVHERIHAPELPYNCSQCGKSFTLSKTLKVHQRIHTGEYPYYCSQCGKGFMSKSHMSTHERTHTGERPYHCSQCGKNFTRSYILKVHQWIHTEEGPLHRFHSGYSPFCCFQCGMGFPESSALIEHQQNCTEKFPAPDPRVERVSLNPTF